MTFAPDLAGTVALVTGVGRAGQAGETVAQAFADLGAVICIVSRDPQQVADRTAALRGRGATAHGFACDLTDPAAVADLVAQVTPLAPDGIASLVNLAGGYASDGTVAETAAASWQHMFSINLTTAFVCTRAFLPLVRRAQGSIVFFSSAAALPGATVSGMAAYAAAKSGVITLMRAVAAEEREAGVRANAIAPTSIRTESNLKAMGERARYVSREAVADWVLWLCSPRSRPLTGQVFRLG
ncbi:MAG TPA: SDR family oxidoreductase [Gemmatimonadaceae bacterium]